MNALVDFLRTYGPVASSDSLCVENIAQTQRQYDVAPIETDAPNAQEIRDALGASPPCNVILTGTAGDGKTYHIRDYLLATFPEGSFVWPGDEGVLSFARPDGVELRVIRDLSEISDSEKAAELASFAAALRGERRDQVYLVAANDGQLLKYFRDAAAAETPEAPAARELHVALSEMLRAEQPTDPNLRLRLINLSRNWSEAIVDSIFDAVLEHPGWAKGCEGCPALEAERPCPILLNRQLLRPEDDAPSIFRVRLKQALQLAAANDQHIPIRQLLTLVVNIILGDARRPTQPLLDCRTARERAKAGQYRDVNPYDNALGLNLRADRRRTNRVFSIFEMFAVGLETNNLIDTVLVQKRPQALFEQLFATERTYGAQIFDPLREAYFRTASAGGNDAASKAFRQGLAAQRRRAFFRLPAENKHEMATPWRLTIFHHGGAYLRLTEGLAKGASREVVDRALKQLIRGLNRAFTGMMTTDEDHLWLAGGIGKTDDPAGRVATIEAIERANPSTFHVRLVYDEATKRPVLQIMSPRVMGRKEPLATLDLRPLLFEYLMRVAGGSLPASFSRQCHQELRHFSLVAQTAISAATPDDEDDAPQRVHILSLRDRGELQDARLEV